MMAATEEEIEIARNLRIPRLLPNEYTDEYLGFQNMVERELKELENSEGKTPVHIIKAKNRDKKAPVHLYLHGGGFVLGHGDRDIYFCSRLAAQTRSIVVDIDYKLAPEYRYPSAFNESYAVARWVFDNIEDLGGDPEKVTINGYSAGGNLAAAVALKAVQTGDFQLRMLLMNYAIIDLVTDPGEKGPGEGSVLVERGRFFNRLYTGGDSDIAKSPYVSMRFAPEEALSRLPETVIVTAGNDSLRFECEEFATHLIELGVKVTGKRFVESAHGFTINCMDQWNEAQTMTIDILNRM